MDTLCCLNRPLVNSTTDLLAVGCRVLSSDMSSRLCRTTPILLTPVVQCLQLFNASNQSVTFLLWL